MADSPEEMETFEMSSTDWKYTMNPLASRHRMSKKQAWTGVFGSDGEDSDSGGHRHGFGIKSKSEGGSGTIEFVSAGISGLQNQQENEPSGHITDESDDEIMSIRLVEERQAERRQPQPKKQPQHPPERDFGDWERHTRGIGMKLLQQMGYKPGKGLGKDLGGIVTPVQAVKRKGKEAVGYFKEETAPAPRRGNEQPQEEQQQEQEQQQHHFQYKKSAATHETPRYTHKTRDEIIKDAKRHPFLGNSAASKVKVIDMTGREQRIYDGYDALATTSAAGPQLRNGSFYCPALMQNLGRVVDGIEVEIIRTDRQLRAATERNACLQHDIARLQRLDEDNQRGLAVLESLLCLLDEFESANSQRQLSVEEACSYAQRFLVIAPSEYALVASGMIAPTLRATLSDWQPLLEPSRGVAAINLARRVIGDQHTFDTLLAEIALPPIRRALSQWSPRQHAEAVALLQQWRNVLSYQAYEGLLTTIVVPALQREVQLWDPLRDPVPVHQWLHPWLSICQEQLEATQEAVLQKLGQCLARWHPRDGSAKALLAPWRSVLKPQTLAAFLQRNVLPRLSECLDTMIINPAKQQMDQWSWFKDWWDLLSTDQVASLLELSFFPKFLRALAEWLNGSPNYQEVATWYAGWKEELPVECLDTPSVQQQLGQALRLMESALAGQSAEYKPPEPRPCSTVLNYYHRHEPAGKLTTKELLEKKAQDAGIVFAPAAGRHYMGKQVFNFGRVLVYVDRTVVFHYNERLARWDPIGMAELMSKATKQ